jgi:hypothetical protein
MLFLTLLLGSYFSFTLLLNLCFLLHCCYAFPLHYSIFFIMLDSCFPSCWCFMLFFRVAIIVFFFHDVVIMFFLHIIIMYVLSFFAWPFFCFMCKIILVFKFFYGC